jgi:hypothetical protein
MSILIDEFYKNYRVETTISLIAVTIIGFLWKFLADLLPFVSTIKIKLLWSLKLISSLIVIIVSLVAYIHHLKNIIKNNNDISSWMPVDPDKYK